MRPLVGAVDGDAFTAGMIGLGVERATAALPQSATGALFTVSGGRAIVFLILGQVTTIIQAQANAVKLVSTPTAGSAVDLCATVDINGLEVGGKLLAPNVAATALGKTNAGAAFGAYGFTIVDPGSIGLNTAASSTGAIKWTLFYVPLDPGASIVAA
jgi:hypothetical protein